MKTLSLLSTLVLFVILSNTCVLGQGLSNKMKMKKFAKKLEAGISSENILHFKESYDVNGKSRKVHTYLSPKKKTSYGGWYGFMKLYHNKSFMVNFVSLDDMLESMDCTKKTNEGIIYDDVNDLLENWNELNDSDKKRIKKRYPLAVKRMNLWNNLILARIKSCKEDCESCCSHILMTDHELLVKDTCCIEQKKLSPPEKKRCNEAKKKVEEKAKEKELDERVKTFESRKFFEEEIADRFGKKFTDTIRKNGTLEKGDTLWLVVRRNGKNLEFSVTPLFDNDGFYTDHKRDYKLGKYTSEKSNDVFGMFASTLYEDLNDTMTVYGDVQGEADANAVEEGSIIYDNYWGSLQDSIEQIGYPDTVINIALNDSIDNVELAYLRAYGIKQLINKELNDVIPNVIKDILVKDHQKINKSHKGGRYRCVTATVIIVDYYHTSNNPEHLTTKDRNVNSYLMERPITITIESY